MTVEGVPHVQRAPGAALRSQFQLSYDGDKGRRFRLKSVFPGRLADSIQLAADEAGVSSGSWIRRACERALDIEKNGGM